MTLKIGLLIDSLIGGGAERVALNFAERFCALGHEVHVIIENNQIEHDVTRAQFKIHTLTDGTPLSTVRPLNKFLLARRLKALVSSLERDDIPFAFFISNAEDMDRLSRMADLRNVYIRYRNSMVAYLEHKIGHTSGLKRQVRRLRWLAKFRGVYGDRDIITVSEALQHEIVDVVKVKPRSLRTIYNPFDFEALRARADEPAPFPTTPYIVYAARYTGRKRQDLLLEAFARARVPHKLVLLGGVYSESDRRWKASIHDLIQRLGLADRVIALDFQSNPYPWIKNADLFAMSSDGEGLPGVLIESMILGTPVVSTDCPTGPREILDGDLACFLSPVGEIEPLSRNIERALASYPAITDARLARFEARLVIDTYLDYCARESTIRPVAVFRRPLAVSPCDAALQDR